jgi:hypothetical protein
MELHTVQVQFSSKCVIINTASEEKLLYVVVTAEHDTFYLMTFPVNGGPENRYKLKNPLTSLAADMSTQQIFGVQVSCVKSSSSVPF